MEKCGPHRRARCGNDPQGREPHAVRQCAVLRDPPHAAGLRGVCGSVERTLAVAAGCVPRRGRGAGGIACRDGAGAGGRAAMLLFRIAAGDEVCCALLLAALSRCRAPRMDTMYVKGLREAKAQVDAGTLTPEEFEKAKKKLLDQREEREKEVSRRAALCAACGTSLVRFFKTPHLCDTHRCVCGEGGACLLRGQ